MRSNNGGASRQLSQSRSLHKNQIGGKRGMMVNDEGMRGEEEGKKAR